MNECCVLTWDLESGIPAEGGPHAVAGEAGVHPAVPLLLAVHRPQEEEAAVGQEDAVGGGVSGGGPHLNTVQYITVQCSTV